MINAVDAIVGRKYQTASGIVVEILEKRLSDIVVKSEETGNNVAVPPTYKLNPIIETSVEKSIQLPIVAEEKVMNEETATETPVKKFKKSNIVDEGLKNSLSMDDIVKNVLTHFPEATEKSIRNLISVRRSKVKKTTTV